MGNLDTVGLVHDAKSGDRFALQKLLFHHHDRLVAALQEKIPADLRRVLSGDDICQEAYVIAIRELPSFTPRGEHSFFAWLLVIAERRLLDAIRLHRAIKRGGGLTPAGGAANAADSVVALLEQFAGSQRTPSQSAIRREAVVAIQDALGRLDEDHREAIRLRHIDGLSLAQIAERTGRTEGVVRGLCARGIDRLAEFLGDPSRFLSSD